MNRFSAFASILCVSMMLSCDNNEDAPTAEFVVGNEGCNAPCTVNFLNESMDAWEFEWDFGDGSTSRERHPSHFYANGPTTGNTYNVTLKATGRSGNEVTSREVAVGQPFQGFIVQKLTIEYLRQKQLLGSDLWDEGAPIGEEPPDLYFEIIDQFNTQICQSAIENNLGNTKIPFTYQNQGCTLSLINHLHTVKFWDQDTGSVDSVNALQFNPFDYRTEKTNTQVIFSKRSGELIKMTVEGVFI